MCAAGMSEERLREIVREEILAARLSEEDHEHPELAHDHYGLAPIGHDHDQTHDMPPYLPPSYLGGKITRPCRCPSGPPRRVVRAI